MTETKFLNVDLELESTSDLSPLSQHFGEEVCVLFGGWVGERYVLSLETTSETPCPSGALDADAVIHDFIALVSALPLPLRSLWDGCCSRVFDIGIDAGTAPFPFRQDVPEVTLQNASSVGAALRITVYPYAPEPGGRV